MSADVLPGDHRAARRHAHDVLRMRAIKSDAIAAQRINVWCSRDCATVATQGVIALLVGCDEKNLASHCYLPSNISFTFAKPTPAAPPIGSARTSGSISVEYITRHRFGESGITSTVPR